MGGTYNNVVINYTSNGNSISFKEDFVLAADSSFFTFFQLPLIAGDARSVLNAPQQVVLTQSTAKRYFGTEDAIGKTLSGDFRDLKVTGVAKDLPANSHFKFDMLISAKTFPVLTSPNYIRFFGHIYVKLHRGASAEAMEAKLPQMVTKYAAPQIENQYGQSWNDYVKAGNNYTYFLQPLRQIHLEPREMEETFTAGGNAQMLKLLTSMAILIIVFACVNFVNLTLVKSAERSQEAALRKVLGSGRWSLMLQILLSALLLVTMATFVAVILVQALLPHLNILVQRALSIPYSVSFITNLLCCAVIMGIVAGSYPALQFSRTPSLDALKGNYLSSGKGLLLRNGLVVLQITFSSVLLVLAIVIHTQTDFLISKDMGFDKSNTLVIQRTATLGSEMQPFRNTVEQMPEVVSISNASRMPGERSNYIGEQYRINGSSEILTAKGMVADDAFFKTLNLKMHKGQSFSEQTNDSLSLIINQAAARLLAPSDPIGMQLGRVETTADGTQRTVLLTITGVVEDFHFQPLQDEISPVVIRSSEYIPSRPLNVLLVKFQGDPQLLTSRVEAVWKQFAPSQPPVYSFLERNMELEYESYSRLTTLFQGVTLLALLVSGLGLYGISANTGHLLRKEISIRKLMGATSFQIWLVLIRKILLLAVIAFALSLPVSYLASASWLENFAYRIPLNWKPFAETFVLILALSLLAISVHAVKSALLQPLDILRSKQ